MPPFFLVPPSPSNKKTAKLKWCVWCVWCAGAETHCLEVLLKCFYIQKKDGKVNSSILLVHLYG